ncbi:HAD-IA family hydrolase [Vibrio fluvialis]|nr:HAD-IA family hydrolase [Vibrio fluvialis]
MKPWEGESKEEVCQRIINYVTEKVISTKLTMLGLHQLVEHLGSKGFKLAIASSSPMSLIKNMVIAPELENKFDVLSSAGELPFAKPYPEVYLNAAAQLGVSPNECIALEDSFSGLLAAKSARVTVVVVPDATQDDHAH